MAVQPGLCRTWSETPKTGFLTLRLICYSRFSHKLAHESMNHPKGIMFCLFKVFFYVWKLESEISDQHGNFVVLLQAFSGIFFHNILINNILQY